MLRLLSSRSQSSLIIYSAGLSIPRPQVEAPTATSSEGSKNLPKMPPTAPNMPVGPGKTMVPSEALTARFVICLITLVLAY